MENYNVAIVYGNYQPVISEYIRRIVLNRYYVLINEIRYIPNYVNGITFNIPNDMNGELEIDHLNNIIYIHVYF